MRAGALAVVDFFQESGRAPASARGVLLGWVEEPARARDRLRSGLVQNVELELGKLGLQGVAVRVVVGCVIDLIKRVE